MALTLLKIERFIARLKKILWGKFFPSNQVYVWHRVAEYREIWRSAAQELGARFSNLTNELWEIELEGKKTRILNDRLEFDNPVILEMAGMKPLIYRLFKEKGLKVPEHLVFRLTELERAYEFLTKYPKGCVIKPANGTSSGQGVTTHIQTRREVRKAAILASLYCPELLMEPLIPGECYRLLVLKGKMIHAVRRQGPKLSGDGRSSVFQLIQAENKRRQKENEIPLEVDPDCLFTLDYQNLTLNSIPPDKMMFSVKSVNDFRRKGIEVRTVYNQTVTDLIGNSLRENAELAAKVLNSDLVGVDFITTDPAISLEKSGGVVNEVNTTPGLHHHYDSKTEKFPQPAVQILSALLERNESLQTLKSG